MANDDSMTAYITESLYYRQVIFGPAARRYIIAAMTFTKSLLHLNPWIYLLTAGLFEVGFTGFMKLSDGFKHWGYNVCFAVCALASFGLLNLSTRQLSLGTAYAVWTGLGAFGTAAIGILFFRDPASFARLAFLTMLIGSIIGLKLVS
jgi:quaternary ammonium compound-resistance protein SugE